MAIAFFWVFEPRGNVDHIAGHGLIPEDVEEAFYFVERFTTSRSSGLPAFVGPALNGDRIFVVYEEIDANTWHVKTAYPI